MVLFVVIVRALHRIRSWSVRPCSSCVCESACVRWHGRLDRLDVRVDFRDVHHRDDATSVAMLAPLERVLLVEWACVHATSPQRWVAQVRYKIHLKAGQQWSTTSAGGQRLVNDFCWWSTAGPLSIMTNSCRKKSSPGLALFSDPVWLVLLPTSLAS